MLCYWIYCELLLFCNDIIIIITIDAKNNYLSGCSCDSNDLCSGKRGYAGVLYYWAHCELLLFCNDTRYRNDFINPL